MRNLILSIAALTFVTAAAFGGENANCVCGKPVSADVPAVVIKVGEADKKVGCCSAACAEAVKKMDPKEAWKAVNGKAHKDATK